MAVPAHLTPPLSLSLDRLVFRAIWVYDLDRLNDNLRRLVVACFCRTTRVTPYYLDALMPQIFDVVEEQMEVIVPEWGKTLTQDEAETAMHNGLIFAARVFRRHAHNLPPTKPIHPLHLQYKIM